MGRLPLFTAKLLDDATPPVEAQLLSDMDYVVRQMNKPLPHYYYRSVTTEDSCFDATNKRVDIICVDELPEASNDNLGRIYSVNDKGYFLCVVSDGKPSRTYKPSCMKCLRQMYYQIVGADLDKSNSKSGDFFGICESGEDRHKRIQTYLMRMKEYGIDLEYISISDYVKQKGIDYIEVRLINEYETKLHDNKRNITFMCDGIIKYKGSYYVVEIKTENSYKFGNRSYVDSIHRNQAYTYSLEFGIDDVIFIYENRDVCTKKSYCLKVKDSDREFIENRIKECDSYVEKKQAPPLEDTVDKHVCQYCDYKTVCKLEGMNEKG